MKNILILFICAMAAIFAVACAAEPPAPAKTPDNAAPAASKVEPAPQEPQPPFEGKIGIISFANIDDDSSYIAAQRMVEKYGADKVIHVEWPIFYAYERDWMGRIVTTIGADPDIKAIIVNQAVDGTEEAFKKLRETRKDLFVIYIYNDYFFSPIPQSANIALGIDELGMGPAMVRQAQNLGAKTFVHYSFPRHMSMPLFSARHDLISETCAELGMEFVDAAITDPAGDIGPVAVEQIISADVPKMVAEYGQDTAFFCTSNSLQLSLIQAVVDAGAIYPQPHPVSPYNIVAANWQSQWYYDRATDSFKDIPAKDVIAHEREALAKKNMLGRISAWPELFSMVATSASMEYAIKWLNGEVPKEGVDVDVLKQLLEEHAGVDVYLTPFVDDGIYYTHYGEDEPTGETYDNFLLMRMDYVTY